MNVKICKKCGIEKPSTSEYYPKSKTSKDGVENTCKECVKERTKKWRLENKDRLSQYNQKWYEDNRDYVKERHKIYYEQNREKISEYRKDYYQNNKELELKRNSEYRKKNYKKVKEMVSKWKIENREKYNKYQREWYQDNIEKERQRSKDYSINNKEKINVRTQRRRAKIKKLDNDYTIKEWLATKEDFNNECAYCGEKRKLTQDHFIPVSKGGGYIMGNIVPACASCNSSKRDRDFFEWYPQKDFYNKDREDKIINYLNTMKQN